MFYLYLFFGLYILMFLLIIILILLYFKYKKYVINHSLYIKEIKYVNSKYQFNDINLICLEYRYDNEIFFNQISPMDFLTYQLIYIQNSVKNEINKTIDNLKKYDLYKDDIKSIKKTYELDINKKYKFDFLKKYIIDRYTKSIIITPTIIYRINVNLILENINGKYKTSKYCIFDVPTIEYLINNLNDRYGDRYNNKDIWDSICRVERGKVSNKMRFAVYARDNNRCRKCGRKTNDLEVDHIIPIAKGGKSTFDNLQTLCHRCNKLKSDTVEAVKNVNNQDMKICPKCGAPLKLKQGKYGYFYGCMNYPKCDYILRKY